MKIHKSVTIDRVMELIDEADQTLSSPGICISCGTEADGVEPDARRYKCESCEANQVFGVEELLMEIA